MRKAKALIGAIIAVVVQNPIIGRSRQSMGNNTFTTYKGLNVLKTKPFSVANPRSAAQVAQREALATLVAAYRLMKTLLNLGFKQAVNPLSPYNFFMKENLPIAVNTSTPGSPEIIYGSFKVAKGTLPNTAITSAVADESDNLITVNWPTALSSPDFSNTDKAHVLAINENTGDIVAQWTLGTNRSGGTVAITATGAFSAGDDIAIYLFFVSADGTQVSDSQYLQITAIA